MQSPHDPPDEQQRIAALLSMGVLDTPPEAVFDKLVALAAEALNVPIVLVSLVDKDRQWFKASHGLSATQTPRDISFCGHAIQQNEAFVVEDALADLRFFDNPLVSGAPHVRFYAGLPLASRDGHHVGTFCCIDQNTRQFSQKELETLGAFAKIAEYVLCSRESTNKQQTTWQQEVERQANDLQQSLSDLSRQSTIVAESEAKRLATEELLQVITSRMPALIAYWDAQERCKFVNEAYQAWFGRTRDSMMGISMNEFMGQSLYEQNTPFIRRALSGETQVFERLIKKKSGDEVFGQVHYIPHLSKSSVLGICVLIFDVTRLKHIEQDLLVANQRSLEARAEAEQANRFKGEFLATVSHEIRTPLAGVIGMTNLLLQSTLEPEARKYAEILQTSGQYLLSLIRNTLDLSKIESGKMVLEVTDFDLPALIHQQINIFYAEVQRKGLALSIWVDPRLPRRLQGDSARLSQVLLNYLNNAIKFTDKGQVAVRCEMEREMGEAYLLRFSVQDTGIGIAPDGIKRLFVPFSQGDVSIARRFGGTGLGLSICRQLAELMNGAVGVESASQRGSTFWFTAMVTKAGTALGGAPESPSMAALPPSARPILVVDDNAVNRLIVASQLKAMGYTYQCVSSGHEALASWSREPYALIFMDCHMPDLDGHEVTQQIRRLEKATNAHTPIVALTANALPADQARCKASGMDDYLAKPIDAESLARVLTRWLPSAPADS